MTGQAIQVRQDSRIAALQVAVLIALCVLLYLPDLAFMLRRCFQNPEVAQGLAAPFLIGLLIYLRREDLSAGVRRGSVTGLLMLLVAVVIYLASSWPFNYGYPRFLAFVIALGGAILATCGWRVFRLSVPMLLIVMLAIPIGARHYASLIIKPETMTIQGVEFLLNFLPGVYVTSEGPDLFYRYQDTDGTIALGEQHRGATFLFATLMIGIFVAYARRRPLWQLVLLLASALPVMMICNFVRLTTWGAMTVYGGLHPLSSAPRFATMAVSILLAYFLFVLTAAVLERIVVSEPSPAS